MSAAQCRLPHHTYTVNSCGVMPHFTFLWKFLCRSCERETHTHNTSAMAWREQNVTLNWMKLLKLIFSSEGNRLSRWWIQSNTSIEMHTINILWFSLRWSFFVVVSLQYWAALISYSLQIQNFRNLRHLWFFVKFIIFFCLFFDSGSATATLRIHLKLIFLFPTRFLSQPQCCVLRAEMCLVRIVFSSKLKAPKLRILDSNKSNSIHLNSTSITKIGTTLILYPLPFRNTCVRFACIVQYNMVDEFFARGGWQAYGNNSQHTLTRFQCAQIIQLIIHVIFTSAAFAQTEIWN